MPRRWPRRPTSTSSGARPRPASTPSSPEQPHRGHGDHACRCGRRRGDGRGVHLRRRRWLAERRSRPSTAQAATTSPRLSAGTYRVHFVDPSGQYGSEWWDDAPRVSRADDIDLGVAARRTGVDAALGAAGRVSGSVTAEGEGPLADVQVAAYADLDGGAGRRPTTRHDALGSTRSAVLAAGITACCSATSHLNWWAALADPASISTSGSTTSPRCARRDGRSRSSRGGDDRDRRGLTRGGTIAGTVTLREGGASHGSWV